jgi:inorganic pyrophosphatase/exopolyphosphatase
MRIITAGASYFDIDVYGGVTAYAELLRKQGIDAQAVTTAVLNDSISPLVRAWKVSLAREYVPQPDDTYTLIDISEAKYFEKFVDVDRIDEIIDHHPGLEDFWQERIGERALIERVGAACTQVFEKWEQAGLASQISETSARLLMCGILDNTLNFGADITTERDRKAYAALKERANLPEDWPAQYFRDCQQVIMQDLASSLTNDTKTPHFRTYPHPTAVGQLALWDAGDIAERSEEIFKHVISAREDHWFMNAISISEKKSYFVTDVPEMKIWLSDVLGITFNGNIAEANRMWLRKEILRADIDRQ